MNGEGSANNEYGKKTLKKNNLSETSVPKGAFRT